MILKKGLHPPIQITNMSEGEDGYITAKAHISETSKIGVVDVEIYGVGSGKILFEDGTIGYFHCPYIPESLTKVPRCEEDSIIK